jgi:hypothetical protein
MALLLIVLALLGFVAAGIGSGSSRTHGSTTVFFPTSPRHPRHQGVHCSARMKARPSVGGNQGCGGPPANP